MSKNLSSSYSRLYKRLKNIVIYRGQSRLNWILHIPNPYHTNRFDCSNKEIIKARPSQRDRETEEDWVVVEQVTGREKRNGADARDLFFLVVVGGDG
jgi:hypothetical protein